MKKNLIYLLLATGIAASIIAFYKFQKPCESCIDNDTCVDCKGYYENGTYKTIGDTLCNLCDNIAYSSLKPCSNINHGFNNFGNADIQIKTLVIDTSTSDRLIFSAEITNDGNNAAYRTQAIITLPAETKVLSFTDNGCVKCKQYAGYIHCQLGNLGTSTASLDDNTRKIVVTTSIMDKNDTRHFAKEEAFGVFAFSRTPDLLPCNNYAYWVADSSLCLKVPRVTTKIKYP